MWVSPPPNKDSLQELKHIFARNILYYKVQCYSFPPTNPLFLPLSPPPFFDGKICFILPTSLILTVNKYFSTSVQEKHNS